MIDRHCKTGWEKKIRDSWKRINKTKRIVGKGVEGTGFFTSGDMRLEV